MRVHIRFMILRDMLEVLAIENACFEYPWTRKDFKAAQMQPMCWGIVAEESGRVVGYMIYELYRSKIVVLNFGIHPGCHRMGVGTQMINQMKKKLHEQRRRCLEMHVKDDNLPMHLFLRKHEFKAVAVVDEFYDNGQDAYYFKFKPFVKRDELPFPPRMTTVWESRT